MADVIQSKAQLTFAASLLMPLLTGCDAGIPDGIEAVDTQQRAVLFIKAGFPFEHVLDDAGNQLVMPDGLKIIVESNEFEREVIPWLDEGAETLDLTNVVRVDATFQLRKANVVVGVTGDGDESSKDYHVVDFHEVYSVQWRPEIRMSSTLRHLD